MASGNDMKAHASTYDAFIGLLKWTLPVIAVIAFTVVLIIAT
ncbi:aa3-type cytochrome c oxidase subunit IV [Novosphingobium sp. Gsoil 351]|nr:aa3-type cytochrome c oxidase subunit IV [Novosphingobium sp. Gsoil 351]